MAPEIHVVSIKHTKRPGFKKHKRKDETFGSKQLLLSRLSENLKNWNQNICSRPNVKWTPSSIWQLLSPLKKHNNRSSKLFLQRKPLTMKRWRTCKGSVMVKTCRRGMCNTDTHYSNSGWLSHCIALHLKRSAPSDQCAQCFTPTNIIWFTHSFALFQSWRRAGSDANLTSPVALIALECIMKRIYITLTALKMQFSVFLRIDRPPCGSPWLCWSQSSLNLEKWHIVWKLFLSVQSV